MTKHLFEIPKYKGTVIYGILNTEDLKIYIGSTSNIQRRAMQHDYYLRNNRHYVDELQKDSDKQLFFLTFERCNNEINNESLLILEQIYMLACVQRGYKLYNTRPVSPYGDIVTTLLYSITSAATHKADVNIRKSFKDSIGVDCFDLKRRKKENRIIKMFNEEEKLSSKAVTP